MFWRSFCNFFSFFRSLRVILEMYHHILMNWLLCTSPCLHFSLGNDVIFCDISLKQFGLFLNSLNYGECKTSFSFMLTVLMFMNIHYFVFHSGKTRILQEQLAMQVLTLTLELVS